MNKYVVMGRAARDPMVKTTNTGMKVARLTIAADRHIAKAKVQPGQQTADFVSLVAFQNMADIVEKYVRKGGQYLIEARIQTSSYTAQDGTKKYSQDVVIERLEFAGPPPQATADTAPTPQAAPQQPITTAPPTQEPTFDTPVSEEDIPF